jgi:hypothetical protein
MLKLFQEWEEERRELKENDGRDEFNSDIL